MGSGRGHGHADADDGDNENVTWALRVAIGVVFVMLAMSGSSFIDGRPGHNGGVVRPLQGKRFRGGGQTDAKFIGAVIDGTEVMVEKESAFLARHLDQTLEVVRAYRKSKGLLDVNDFYGGAEHCCGALRLINVPGMPLEVIVSGVKPWDAVIGWLTESLKYLAPLSNFPNVTIG